MLYFARGSATAKLSVADLRKGLFQALEQLGTLAPQVWHWPPSTTSARHARLRDCNHACSAMLIGHPD